MTERYARQSFLGSDSEHLFETATVGCVGLGGGGSHINQQLAHAGVHGYVLADKDIVEESNLNRLIGATYEDVRLRTPKVLVAHRVIKGLVPEARVLAIQTDWQMPEAALALRKCSVIFGCVDSLRARAELEQFCRRFLIPYIDIGMDVHKQGAEYAVHGQVTTRRLNPSSALMNKAMSIGLPVSLHRYLNIKISEIFFKLSTKRNLLAH
jgi:molybdopterin-synthase adenylyltransferase